MHGARHDLFSFPSLLPNHPSQSQVAPSGLLLLRHLSAPSENPRRFSVVIPLKSSYRPCFQGALRVAGSSRFRYSSESVCRRAFHPVAVLACRELYQLPPFCQFFSRCFFEKKFQTHKKYFIINILRFHFFLKKKPLSSRKRPKCFRNPKFLSIFSSWLRIDEPKAIPEGRLQHLSSPGRNLFPPLPYSSSPHSRRHCIRHHPSY